MSHHSPGAALQPQSPSSQSFNHPELIRQIERLQAAAQDVLAIYAEAGQGRTLRSLWPQKRAAKFAAIIFRRERCSMNVNC